jgi:formate dehydrogenase subunit gamma
MAEFAPWNTERAQAIIARHAMTPGATLPILHALQAEFGFIHHDAVALVAATLNLSRAAIHGIVTFYHDFRQEPLGRHTLQVCRAEACQAVGAASLADHLRRRLGVDWHETTADGAVTLQPVFCLGLCATGPAALLDGTPHARLTQASADRMLETLA